MVAKNDQREHPLVSGRPGDRGQRIGVNDMGVPPPEPMTPTRLYGPYRNDRHTARYRGCRERPPRNGAHRSCI
jgi:hypothetical protein